MQDAFRSLKRLGRPADTVTMVENTPADLVMLAGEVAVTVTREEQHQAVLTHYGPGRHVVVELTWCAITTGKYRGERAIEVRLDGRRVGELTYLMSQRYAPLVAQVNARGGRAGCEALIERDARGLQLTLRLPSETDAPTVRVPAVTTTFAATPTPMPAVTPTVMSGAARRGAAPVAMAGAAPVTSSPGNTVTRHPMAWGIGAAVFAILIVAGIVGGGDKQQSASPTAADATTTLELPTTTVVPTTTTVP